MRVILLAFTLLLISVQTGMTNTQDFNQRVQQIVEKTYANHIRKENRNIKNWKVDAIIKHIFNFTRDTPISPNLVLAIMDVESDYKSRAVSYRGKKPISYGLMQIYKKLWLHPKNDKNLIKAGIINTPDDLFNVELNIKSGVYILKELHRICTVYEESNMLERRGYVNMEHCQISRYNGSTREEYSIKVLTSLKKIHQEFYNNLTSNK